MKLTRVARPVLSQVPWCFGKPKDTTPFFFFGGGSKSLYGCGSVGQNQWHHFGVGAPSILVYFGGDWEWPYVETHPRFAKKALSARPSPSPLTRCPRAARLAAGARTLQYLKDRPPGGSKGAVHVQTRSDPNLWLENLSIKPQKARSPSLERRMVEKNGQGINKGSQGTMAMGSENTNRLAPQHEHPIQSNH